MDRLRRGLMNKDQGDPIDLRLFFEVQDKDVIPAKRAGLREALGTSRAPASNAISLRTRALTSPFATSRSSRRRALPSRSASPQAALRKS